LEGVSRHGSWHYNFVHRTPQNPEGKNRGVLKGARSREDAERLFAEIKPRLLNGLPPIVEAPVVTSTETLEAYAHKWLNAGCIGLRHKRRKKPSTIGFYTDHVENHIVPVLGSTPIASLTRSQCKAFVLQVDKPESRRRSEHAQEQATDKGQVFRARRSDGDALSCPRALS
jgi:hypothetical protein